MTTATAVTTSTTSTGIGWKVLANGPTLDSARVKLTFAGQSREVQLSPSEGLDPLTEAVLWAVRNEVVNNMTPANGAQREGTIAINCASTLVRLQGDTDYVAGF